MTIYANDTACYACAFFKKGYRFMRKSIIAGNWKMHGSQSTVQILLTELTKHITANDAAELIVFPPFVYLEQAKRLLEGSVIKWGAQNLATEQSGAFTGEISATMLRDFACQYVLVGHSERRSLYGETNEIVAKKFAIAKQAGLLPVLCVGETLAEREQGLTQQVVTHQLQAILHLTDGVKNLQNAVLAYEPVWAIGTGLTATPEQAQEIHAMLRQQVAKHDATIAQQLSILYGGSVKASNAKALFAMPDIDGGLVGGASLDAKEFIQIFHSIEK
jgi:triosephosphate isomerase